MWRLKRRGCGYRRLFVLMRRQGEPSGFNQMYQVYPEEGLTVRKRRARRKAAGTRPPILVEARPQRPLVPGLRPRPVRQRTSIPRTQRLR